LEDAGFEVVGEADNGEKAIEVFKEVNPDIVTLDVVMPDKSGIEVLKEILKIKPDVKVIIVSAMGQTDMITEALNLGAKDYVVKPFQPHTLVEVIKRVAQS
ncbi:MAG: response regulator, partial [candidate division WOR-3 bacterium]